MQDSLAALTPGTSEPFAAVESHVALGALSAPAPRRSPRRADAEPTRSASYAAREMREPPMAGACPAGMAKVTGYCIDRYEAYVVELDEQGREAAHSPYAPVDGLRVRAKVAPGVLPQGYISQVQALQACQNAGKRLCTAAEFSQACRGPDARASYPYGGNRRQAGKCNEGKGSAVSVVFGQGANYDHAELNDPRLNQWPGGLAKTGAFAASVSPFGVFDLVGNLHEWGAEVRADGHGFFRGGFYGDAEQNGAGCNYVTTAHASNYHDYSTGFRCCQDADSERSAPAESE
jgi:sulfatase modifying factor 1